MTLSGAKKAEGADEVETTDSTEYSSRQLILGYSLIFITAWIYAANCILNRALKGVHHAILMFWHGTIGLCIAATAVLIEAGVEDKAEGEGGVRIFHYDSSIYLLMLAAALFDSLTVNAVTIAFQSDSSGFVSLISYVNILYAFAADLLIFNESFSIMRILSEDYFLIGAFLVIIHYDDESFSVLELVAAVVILVVTVCVSIYKIKVGNEAKLRRADSFTSAEDVNMSMVKRD